MDGDDAFRRRPDAEVDDAPKLTYTILRPVEFMSNFVPPLASYQFPDMTSATGTWESAFPADFANLYVEPRDVGRVADAAIVDPARWAGRCSIMTTRWAGIGSWMT